MITMDFFPHCKNLKQYGIVMKKRVGDQSNNFSTLLHFSTR